MSAEPVNSSTPLATVIATISDAELRAKWADQARQYPTVGDMGIEYFRGDVSPGKYIDCLLYRGHKGQLLGILNHYPFDFPPHETAGSITVWTRPNRLRRGIASRLVEEADRRWDLNPKTQQYSEGGLALARNYLRRRNHSDGESSSPPPVNAPRP